MSASVSFPAEHCQPSLQAGGFRDADLAELPPDVHLRLSEWLAKDWFSSPGYAQSYSYPPAQRVSYITAEDGKILDACFYLEKKWAGIFQCVALSSGLNPAGPVHDLLLQSHSADLIRIPFYDGPSSGSHSHSGAKVILRKMADDHCIELPATAEDYLKSLGAQTRKHLPYYLRRLRKEWGNGWRVEYASGDQIGEKSYRDLLSLNALRMGRKHRRSLWSPQISEHRWPLVRENGLLGSIFHEERLVAGTLSFTYGRDAYLVVIAHDPDEDRLNLGNISLWLTIEQLIAKGFQRYHLLWGSSPYKKQFGAVAHPLYEKIVFLNPHAAHSWCVAEFLYIERMCRLGAAAIQKAAWLLSAEGRASSHKEGLE